MSQKELWFFTQKKCNGNEIRNQDDIISSKEKSFYYILSHHPEKWFLCQIFFCIGKPNLDIPSTNMNNYMANPLFHS